MMPGMFEILPNLYLSTYNQVRLSTDDFFQVNCTKDLPMVRTHGMRIAVHDDPYEAYAMLTKLTEAMKTIDAELAKPGRKVVVHCLAAVSRSPTVICAYLMWSRGMTLDDAIKYVRSIRPEAFTFSTNFKEALETFESQLKNKRDHV